MKHICDRCDKKRSTSKGVLCSACTRELLEEAESKPFMPKFADVYKRGLCDAKDFVVSWLDGDKEVDDHGEAFGRLIQILFDKKVLSKEDVCIVAMEYVSEESIRS